MATYEFHTGIVDHELASCTCVLYILILFFVFFPPLWACQPTDLHVGILWDVACHDIKLRKLENACKLNWIEYNTTYEI